MAFTKQHYVKIAAILMVARQRVETGQLTADVILDLVTTQLADMFMEDNGRFDRARFYDAADPRIG